METLQEAILAYGYTNVVATVSGNHVHLIVNNGTKEWNFRIEGNTAISVPPKPTPELKQ